MILGLSHDWGARRQEEEPPSRKHQVKLGIPENVITFSDNNVKGIQVPHHDPVIISTIIAKHNVKKNLVNNRSSADLLFFMILPKNELAT